MIKMVLGGKPNLDWKFLLPKFKFLTEAIAVARDLKALKYSLEITCVVFLKIPLKVHGQQ